MVAQDLFDLGLGRAEPLARLAQPLHALLEQLQRLVEVEVLPLEPPHDLLQPLQLARKARLARHQDFATRAATSPSVTRSRKASPGENWATRFSTWPSGSRARE